MLFAPGADLKRLAATIADLCREQLGNPAPLRDGESSPGAVLKVLVENGRLGVLPGHLGAFDVLKAEAENTLDVTLTTAAAVNDDERTSIVDSLNKRFGRQVRLTVHVDQTLIGGARLQVGDRVIDGTVRPVSTNWQRHCAPSRRQRKEDMALKASEISELLKQRIKNFESAAEARDTGTVIAVTDGICRIHGLADAKYGEMLEFPKNTFGLALNLERDSVGAVVLGDYKHISEGDTVKTTGRILEVPVGEGLLGRVVDPLGNPIDGKGPIKAAGTSPIEKVAPGVITRQSVNQPVQTGLKAIDAMVPSAAASASSSSATARPARPRSRSTRSSTRRARGVKCIYVAIGQKASSIANVVRKLEEFGAMDHTIVVAASAADLARHVVHRAVLRLHHGRVLPRQGRRRAHHL